MRALHLVKTSVGAAWACRQMSELVALGVDTHVALPPGGPMETLYRRAGVKVHLVQTDLPLNRPLAARGLFDSVRRLVDEVQPDVIHSHFVGTTLTMRLALGKKHPVPRVFQVPGPLHLEHRFFRQLELASAGPSDRWIASCKWTEDCYRNAGIGSSRLFLSYYGLQLDGFQERPTGKLRRELGLGSDAEIVGMVGFMYAPKKWLGQSRGIKGHEDLIDAMRLVSAKRTNAICVCVGGAWNNAVQYEASIRKYAESRCPDRIVFLGTRDDVPDLYADFDVVAHPSHSENVGGAAESLLLAVPTVATNVGGFPDLIRPDETGWLVPPRDPTALAIALAEALGDRNRSKNLAQRGQALARDLFNVKRSGREVFDIYATILLQSANTQSQSKERAAA